MERFARAAGELGQGGAPVEGEVMALARTHGIEVTRSIDEGLAEAPARPAYLTLARFSGDPDRLVDDYRRYSSVMSGVGRDHGLILHAGAKTDDGFLVVNLWPSAPDLPRLDLGACDDLQPARVAGGRLRLLLEHHEVADFVVLTDSDVI